jgi:Ca2+-binding EF-hand superfamily protein
MNRFALAGAAAAALAAVPAPAAIGSERTHGQPITRAEMQARVQAKFARADADRDGFVTQAEARAAAGEWKARHARRGAGRGNLFERLDSNKDGSISRAEAEAVPVRADRKGSGERRAALFARFDANNDGMVTRAEVDSRRSARAGFVDRLGGKLFGRADADGDGLISLSEATAQGLARFERLDSNRDGVLTAQERRAHRAWRKARPAG